jgi:hypothetical protein
MFFLKILDQNSKKNQKKTVVFSLVLQDQPLEITGCSGAGCHDSGISLITALRQPHGWTYLN